MFSCGKAFQICLVVHRYEMFHWLSKSLNYQLCSVNTRNDHML